jgi:hypothetical protein
MKKLGKTLDKGGNLLYPIIGRRVRDEKGSKKGESPEGPERGLQALAETEGVMALLRWYDIDPKASDLWVIEGPADWTLEEVNRAVRATGDPPPGGRWVSDYEWETYHGKMEIVS